MNLYSSHYTNCTIVATFWDGFKTATRTKAEMALKMQFLKPNNGLYGSDKKYMHNSWYTYVKSMCCIWASIVFSNWLLNNTTYCYVSKVNGWRIGALDWTSCLTRPPFTKPLSETIKLQQSFKRLKPRWLQVSHSWAQITCNTKIISSDETLCELLHQLHHFFAEDWDVFK